jgi:hypothetical protein
MLARPGRAPAISFYPASGMAAPMRNDGPILGCQRQQVRHAAPMRRGRVPDRPEREPLATNPYANGDIKWNLPAMTYRDANVLDTDPSSQKCSVTGPGHIPPPGSVSPPPS